MSQHGMVWAATNTLTRLLDAHMTNRPGTISATPPDVQLKDPPGTKRVNLFLYRVEENPHLKNHDAASPPGHPGKPPLGLDLHYLLTAYGGNDEDVTGAQELLGDAMAVLHEHALIHPRDPAYAAVRDPLLDQAREQIKIGLEPITLEDLTKVWTSLTAPYRLSAAYVVNVVQIRSDMPAVVAPLVRSGTIRPDLEGTDADPIEGGGSGRRLLVLTNEVPTLASVGVLHAGEDDDAPPRRAYATIDDRLVLHGTHFGLPPEDGDPVTTHVHLGPLRLPAPPDAHRPDRILVTVPDHVDLEAGSTPVHVTTHQGGGRVLSTNRLLVAIVPRVDGATVTTAEVPDEDAIPTPANPNPTKIVPAVHVTGKRLYDEGRTCATVLTGDGTTLMVAGSAYVDASESGITVPLPEGTAPVGMTVRVRVDGHENIPEPPPEVTP